ncbi:MAG TPA: ABC transporter substrate-binding protein [Acidimicrobiia bacterium]|nr:ABC transporter substrate-binding protein [Acidimicrobiia bacterium]
MFRRIALPVTLALVVAACGGGTGADTTTTTVGSIAAAYPVEVAGVTIPARPERILSGSATHTEILFALGAGDQVAAVDLWSDFPPEIADLPRFDAFEASVEAIADLDPDLVILTFDPGVVDGLAALGIPVLVLDAPTDLEGVFAQYADLAVAIDRVDEAADLIAGMRDEIDDIIASLPQTLLDSTYYHELDPSFYSVTSDTFLGSVYGMLGLTSIADGTGESGYPQLSPEFVIDSDPDFVFLAHTAWSGDSPDSVAQRPGWESLSAVVGDRVVAVDEGLSSRWGPRIVEYMRSIADVVLGVAVP